jgi:SOS regulatory protein LexA
MQPDYKKQIISFHQSHRRMPTYTEMMALFGFKSKNAVARLVDKMIVAGIVTKDKLGKLLPTSMFDSLPLLGSVKAGFPSAVDEVLETLNLESYLIKKKGETYMVEVDGQSMIDAHIEDGDIVIAERSNTARDKQIVIAQIDGEHTLKYFRTDGKKSWLEPANKKFKPMHPKTDLQVIAIIRGVIRKY